jgi:hypothetical protein
MGQSGVIHVEIWHAASLNLSFGRRLPEKDAGAAAHRNRQRKGSQMRVNKAMLAAVGLLAGVANAQTLTQTLNEHKLLGINRSTGAMVSYEFGTNWEPLKTIGTLQKPGGGAMTGVDAAVLFPGFINIYAFWLDPANHQNHMVFVNVQNAEATVVHQNLEGGRITGATHFATADDPYTIFVVQQEKVTPPASVSGLVNLNPNNAPDHEFTCTRDDGSTFTRDHLHEDSPVNSNGTFYQGGSTLLHFRPKGNGNQNGLIINGEAFNLQNSNTYTFTGVMDVRVFNDHVKGGKAMGKWWVEIISGQILINADVQILSPHRLAKVCQVTGAVNEIMVLSRAYNSLATQDGVVFYATSGAQLYKLDSAVATETSVGTTSMGNGSGLEFMGNYLMGYDVNTLTLTPLNPEDGTSLMSGVNFGLGQLGTIVFSPVATHASFAAAMFD